MIERTYFTDRDLQPIVDWFSANATEYFDNVEYQQDENGQSCICYCGKTKALEIIETAAENHLTKFKIYYGNGNAAVTVSTAWTSGNYGTSNSSNYIRRLTKTDGGISIAMSAKCRTMTSPTSTSMDKDWSVPNALDSFFITKSNDGKTCFVYDKFLGTGYPYYNGDKPFQGNSATAKIYALSLDSSAEAAVSPNGFSSNFGVIRSDYFQLIPITIPYRGLRYTPKCLITYAGNIMNDDIIECTLEQNGKKYIYNGYIALKE